MAEAYVSDKFAQVRGFKVEIDSASGVVDVDAGWDTVSSGEAMIEVADASVGADKFHTSAPGHKSVGEITLRGAMTDKRAALCQWINETVQGKPWKRNIAITPVLLDGTEGETLILIDCVLAGYTFPLLATRDPRNPCGPGPLTEAVRFTYRDWTIRA